MSVSNCEEVSLRTELMAMTGFLPVAALAFTMSPKASEFRKEVVNDSAAFAKSWIFTLSRLGVVRLPSASSYLAPCLQPGKENGTEPRAAAMGGFFMKKRGV